MAWPASVPTFAAGATTGVVAKLNDLRDALKAIGDPRPAYTPVLSGWTKSNGTLTGKSLAAGKLIIASGVYTVGSSDIISGAPNISLPVTSVALTGRDPVGWATLFDTSASAWRHWPVILSSTTTLAVVDPSGTALSPTAPWTWATGDRIQYQIMYEAA